MSRTRRDRQYIVERYIRETTIGAGRRISHPKRQTETEPHYSQGGHPHCGRHDPPDRRCLGPALECGRTGRSSCRLRRRRSLPSPAPPGRSRTRGHSRVPEGTARSWRVRLAFEVTYIKQQGSIAWDVGTYRMNILQDDGTKKEDRGKYLSVWRRVGNKWLLAADALSSDLPPSN